MSLEQRALEWIDPYWNAEHLVRTRDWARELEPGAGEALLLAALTHDMERHFPGGPHLDVATQPPDDRAYREAHSERSARIVSEWLRAQEDGDAERVEAVEQLTGPSRAEPGCLFYQPHVDPENPRVFFIYEQYADEDACKAHGESEHFQRIGLGEAIPLLENRERAFYETLDV